MSYWTLILIGALVTWRVSRFIIADDLIEGSRHRFLSWLNTDREERWKLIVTGKLFLLFTCPWCVGIYVSAGYLLLTRLFVVDSIPMPVWSWLAIAAAAMVPYQFLDGDWIVTLARKGE